MEQIHVTLPDGSVKDVPKGTTPAEIARSISPRLADAALVARVAAPNDGEGELIDLGCVPEGSRQNLFATTVAVDWSDTDDGRRILLTDAQTSGGLLLCVAEGKLESVLKILRKACTPSAAVIGKIVTRRRRGPLICMTG